MDRVRDMVAFYSFDVFLILSAPLDSLTIHIRSISYVLNVAFVCLYLPIKIDPLYGSLAKIWSWIIEYLFEISHLLYV